MKLLTFLSEKCHRLNQNFDKLKKRGKGERLYRKFKLQRYNTLFAGNILNSYFLFNF